MPSIHLNFVDSTSLYIKRNRDKMEDLTFVSANFQLCGRGRLGRTWQSEAGKNLLFSICIKNKELINKYEKLSIATAVAVYNALKELGLKYVSIKWPNDVYVKGKKICGILLEKFTYGSYIDFLIVGVGLNVNQKEFDCDATSIILEKQFYQIRDVKAKVYAQIKTLFKEIENGNNEYLTIAKKKNYLLRKKVYAYLPNSNEKVLVKVLDINDDNSLKVLCDGVEYNLRSGEITFHKD